MRGGQEAVRAEAEAKKLWIRIDHMGQRFSFWSIF